MKKFLYAICVIAMITTSTVSAVSADEIDDAQEILDQYETDYQNAREAKDDLEAQVDDAKQNLNTCKENIKQIENLLSDAETEMQEAVDDNAPKSTIDVQVWSKSVSKATRSAKSEITAYEDRLAELNEQQSELEDDLQSLQELLSEQTDIMWDYDYLVNEASHDIDSLQEQQEERERLQTEADQLAEEAAQKKAEEEARQQETEQTNTNSAGSYSTSTASINVPYYESTGNAIVDAAYSQLGVPYVWGGATPGKAFDCSGLVQYCLRQAGIRVSHSSTAIGQGGIAVSDPQPGDIVCYSGHCAIYIGNGKMIHAPHSGEVVKIASVYGNPWYRRYQ